MGIEYPIYFLSKIKPYSYTELPIKYDRHRQKSGGVFLFPPNHAKNLSESRQKIGVNPKLK